MTIGIDVTPYEAVDLIQKRLKDKKIILRKRMKDMLKRLNEKILNNDFFDKKYLQAIDIDELLDLRDDKEFDDGWVRVFEKTKEYSIKSEIVEQIDEIRENVFKKIYDLTESSDLAAYISDDFDLMCRAYIVELNDEWLAKVAHIYNDKRIPSEKMMVVAENYKEEFLKLFE